MTSTKPSETPTVAEALGAPPGRLVPAGEHELWISEMGEGRPTVFLHGGGPGGTSWTDFWPTVPYFGDRRVVLVDLINYGYSSALTVPGGRWTYQADSAAAALRNLGIAGADFVCNSVGGSVALALAGRHPDLVRKLVVTGSEPMKRGSQPMTVKLGKEGHSAWDVYYGGEGPTAEKMRDLMRRFEYYQADAVDERNVELRLHYSEQAGSRLLGETLMNGGPPEDIEDLMKTVQARVLFLWGKYDIFAKPDYALTMANTVPFGEVFVMNDTGHHPQEERPADFASIVKAWLDQPIESDE